MLLDKKGNIQGISQDEWKKRFRDRLLSIMKEKNMNQSKLAKASGLSTSRISEYINMKTAPTIFALINIADTFDMTVGELIDWEEIVCK